MCSLTGSRVADCWCAGELRGAPASYQQRTSLKLQRQDGRVFFLEVGVALCSTNRTPTPRLLWEPASICTCIHTLSPASWIFFSPHGRTESKIVQEQWQSQKCFFVVATWWDHDFAIWNNWHDCDSYWHVFAVVEMFWVWSYNSLPTTFYINERAANIHQC